MVWFCSRRKLGFGAQAWRGSKLKEDEFAQRVSFPMCSMEDWGSRYSISIGVAKGFAFSHGCASGLVLLLDLSSKSILLKSLKEPQVGDVELCKVIDPMKSTGSLSAVAGSVDYIPPGKHMHALHKRVEQLCTRAINWAEPEKK